jgi:hypothetical protein
MCPILVPKGGSVPKILFAVVFLWVVVGCSGASDPTSPVSVAKQYLDAYAKADKATVVELTCERLKAEASAAMDRFDSTRQIDTSLVNYVLFRIEDSSAQVRPDGTLKITQHDTVTELPVGGLIVGNILLRNENGWKVCGSEQ